MRKIIALLAACLLGVVLFNAAPASANVQSVQRGANMGYAQHGYTCSPISTCIQQHRMVTVTDGECDGHDVHVTYTVSGEAAGTYHYIADTDGCGGNSYSQNWSPQGKKITAMRVCEFGDDGQWYCGAWGYPSDHAYA